MTMKIQIRIVIIFSDWCQEPCFENLASIASASGSLALLVLLIDRNEGAGMVAGIVPVDGGNGGVAVVRDVLSKWLSNFSFLV